MAKKKPSKPKSLKSIIREHKVLVILLVATVMLWIAGIAKAIFSQA